MTNEREAEGLVNAETDAPPESKSHSGAVYEMRALSSLPPLSKRTLFTAGMLDPNTRRALVFLRYGIGDVVMETPALEALRHALPRARITAVGAFPAIQLLEGCGPVDEVLDLRDWGLTHRWDNGSFQALQAFRDWFLAGGFELVLDVHHAPPCLAHIIWGMGIRTVESMEEVEARALNEGKNGVEAVVRAASCGWGLHEVPAPMPHVAPGAEHFELADLWSADRGITNTTAFAVSPVASLELKRWPLENLASVVDYLIGNFPEPVLALCGPQEEVGDALRQRIRYPERLHVVGPLHLLVVAALLTRCRALLSNDTGIMHIAAAVGTPTLGVFGPTKASIYRPPGRRVFSAEPEALSCPHREITSLHPPGCFAAGECLLGSAGCITGTPVGAVKERLRELLAITGVTHPVELPAG